MFIALQIISFVVAVYIAFSHKKKNILIATFMFNFLQLALYLIIKDYSTAYSSILINIRSIVFLFQDKIKTNRVGNIIPFLFVIAHITVGVTHIEHWYQTFTMIAPIIIILSLWFEKNRQRMRVEQSVSDILWIVYNAIAGIWIVSAVKTLCVFMSIIAMIKNKDTIEQID